jgi:5-formyltetrahydrofolate cyclo-ligase
VAAPHLLLRVESNGTNGTGGWRRPPLRMNPSDILHPARPELSHSPGRDTLRREMRKRRRALPIAERTSAANNLTKIVARQRILRPGAHVAVYLAHRGEIDLAPVITRARRLGCTLYLPAVVHSTRGSMHFVRFERDQTLRRNRFGILEPDFRKARPVTARRLDVVLLPLVAVDPRGWRLGSGAGFYDRRFSHLRIGRTWRKPRLIGVAYEFQRVPIVVPQPWDVPLDGVVTERAFYPSHRPLT